MPPFVFRRFFTYLNKSAVPVQPSTWMCWASGLPLSGCVDLARPVILFDPIELQDPVNVSFFLLGLAEFTGSLPYDWMCWTSIVSFLSFCLCSNVFARRKISLYPDVLASQIPISVIQPGRVELPKSSFRFCCHSPWACWALKNLAIMKLSFLPSLYWSRGSATSTTLQSVKIYVGGLGETQSLWLMPIQDRYLVAKDTVVYKPNQL